MPEQLLAKIMEDEEGRKRDVYRDSEDFWSIGIGCLVSRNKDLTIEQARKLCGAPWDDARIDAEFHKRLTAAEKSLYLRLPWAATLPQWPRWGLINMTFQMGLGGVLGFPNMLASLRAGNFALAEQHALDSWGTPTRPGWRTQTPGRCKRTAAMIGNKPWERKNDRKNATGNKSHSG